MASLLVAVKMAFGFVVCNHDLTNYPIFDGTFERV